jgi:DNA-binding CsgD family transcriptional regulator
MNPAPTQPSWLGQKTDRSINAARSPRRLDLARVHSKRVAIPNHLEREPALTGASLHIAGLTPRETEILHWVAEGKRDGEIAIIVGASVRTIHKHVQRILFKLGVENRTAAAIEAMRRNTPPTQ